MARCLSPIQVKNPRFNGQDKMLSVRCGRCEGCLRTLVNDWSFRLENEAKDHYHVHFITLTYSPKFVPLTKTNLPTLKKEDVQKFWKRLRKRTRGKIKYFIVGEYGTRSFRPHYHAIVYGCENPDFYGKAWTQGFVHVGDYFSGSAIRYTLKYMYKKGQIPMFDSDDRLPEFRMMSKKLGSRYLKNTFDWHYKDLQRLSYVINSQGYKQTLPRYYRKELMKYIDEDKLKEILPDREDYEWSYQRRNQLLRKFENDKKQHERVKI